MNSELQRIVSMVNADLSALGCDPLTSEQVALLAKAGHTDEALSMLDDLEARVGMSSHVRADAAAYVVGVPLRSLTLFGSQFDACSTGGGCVALICSAPSGAHVLITAYDEAELPSARDWLIGIYDPDGMQRAWMSHEGHSQLLNTLRA